MTALAVAACSLAIWIYLALARGAFWRAAQDDAAMHLALRDADFTKPWPKVVAIVPARDEAELIGAAVESLLRQQYAGEFAVVVVDDHSQDGTAAEAQGAAARTGCSQRLTVIAAPTLPCGWTGKLWAVAQGVEYCEALAEPPEFLLLTDADILYEPRVLSALVHSALDERLVLSSLMVKLRCKSLAERTLIPAFIFFFQMLYPFAWVRDPRRSTAAAAGGSMLVQRKALQSAGGIASIRGQLIDDCALARQLKRFGPIQLALGEHLQSLRPYPAIGDIRRMVVRSAYAQLSFSAWRLAIVVLAMLVVFIAPVPLAMFGARWTQALAIAAWVLMALLFAPILKRYRVFPTWAFALPAIAAAFLVFTVESAIQHLRGRGGLWKGRIQGPGIKTQ